MGPKPNTWSHSSSISWTTFYTDRHVQMLHFCDASYSPVPQSCTVVTLVLHHREHKLLQETCGSRKVEVIIKLFRCLMIMKKCLINESVSLGFEVVYLVVLQLGAVLGQCGVQELVLLCGLDHTTPAKVRGGDYRSHMIRGEIKGKMTEQRETFSFIHSPVESKLTHRLQDVDLSCFSELLTADTAGYETTCPPYTCTESRERRCSETEQGDVH